MDHSTEELLFAVHVRDIAKQLRDRALIAARNEWKVSHPAPAKPDRTVPHESYKEQLAALAAGGPVHEAAEQDFSRLWAIQHPLAEFIGTALNEITAVAEQVRALRS